ncbi:MAG: T9SS type B sorting domain-containing protein [Bacteroidales bacterium]|nr:T9SS type B sorting domain-containing protein [Bacteroidales bacterium]
MASLFFSLKTFPQALFEAPDTVCIRDSMQVANLSPQSQSYYWNFCSASLDYMPVGENIDAAGLVNGPAFISVVKEDNDFYAFITNHEDGTLTRQYYGNSFDNLPVTANLGSVAGINHLEGIQVINDNGRWYGFMVGGIGSQSSLIRLDFGTSPGNTPLTANLGNLGELSYPIDLTLFFDGTQWTGFTVNYTTSTITRFIFSAGLNNPPVAQNLGNIGNLDKPCGINMISEAGNWYAFVTNFGSGTLTRLDFNNSPMNTPTGTNLGSLGELQSPFDLTLIRDCEQIYGWVANHYTNELIRLQFSGAITAVPQAESIGNIGNLYQPHGMSNVFRENDMLYLLVGNISNSVSRFHFQPCSNASLPFSADRNPPKVTYDSPGIYNVSLTIDEGLPTQSVFCKDVVAFDNPVISLGNDTTLMPGTQIELSPGEGFDDYSWSTGDNTSSLFVSNPGEYYVTVTDTNGCNATARITVTIALHIPNFFTPNGDGINDRWEIAYFQTNPNATIEIFDRFGKKLAGYRGSDSGWDGTYRGRQLKADTYWYVISFDDEPKPRTGYVAIVR